MMAVLIGVSLRRVRSRLDCIYVVPVSVYPEKLDNQLTIAHQS